jgi:glycyl-tRNA synthetase beta chain
MADFLVEIGTEELPPKALMDLANAFHDHVASGFKNNTFGFNKTKIFATPRRIAILLEDLDKQAPSKDTTIWGPPTKIAFNTAGEPTAAGIAFAKKNGIPIESLSAMIGNNQGKEKLCSKSIKPGLKVEDLAENLIRDAISALPIPKKMRWGSNAFEFIRPLQWVLILFGNKIIKSEIMGLKASNITYGHRFHSKNQIIVKEPREYESCLREAYVIACFSKRRDLISAAVKKAAKKVCGIAIVNDSLLDEVTALNEWPIALVGSFDKEFLGVPTEALISSMAEHQKYFHLTNTDGELLPLFITISNIESKDPSQIVSGNERVIRPRLSDAAFFYNTDKKTTLEKRRESLKSIIFQEKLGTVYEKTDRLSALAEYIAPIVNADVSLSVRAAQLCKSDLVTDMVGEFESLQGTMGKYYATNDGERPEVADAIQEHYLPKFSRDVIPKTAIGITLAISDRLDTLVGIFGIGQQPSGSKDPFALRRSSLGLLRIIVEHNINLNLYEVLKKAATGHQQLQTDDDKICMQVLTYVKDRFKSWYEEEGIPTEVFLSVSARELNNPLDIHRRVNAVHEFTRFPEAVTLAAANKRVSNILAKNPLKNMSTPINKSLLSEPSELALTKMIENLEEKIQPLLQEQSYTSVLKLLSGLAVPIDNFFDDVMVVTDDDETRINRLILLHKLRALFLQVADISLLVPAR